MITLITGGARSGKSNHALKLAMGYESRVFIATAKAFDDEMQKRIDKHQQERGDTFTTIEEPLDLADALGRIPENTDVVLVDCLTVWIGNLMYKHGDDADSFPATTEFLTALKNITCDIIIVTNETGMGIVPDNAASRNFRDISGRLNQDIAHMADSVILTIAGLPLELKK